MKHHISTTITAITLGLASALSGAARAEVSAQTLKNLNTAFQGESNAANRYAKFAVAVEKEHAKLYQ